MTLPANRGPLIGVLRRGGTFETGKSRAPVTRTFAGRAARAAAALAFDAWIALYCCAPYVSCDPRRDAGNPGITDATDGRRGGFFRPAVPAPISRVTGRP